MNEPNKLQQPLHPVSLRKRALLGAGIALVLITIFIFAGGDPNPGSWPKLWFIRPLIVVPIAGAMGGVFYYLMDNLRYQGGWRKFLANLVSLIIYIIGLWFGTIAGLAGTLWN
jgi:hypothetical protein